MSVLTVTSILEASHLLSTSVHNRAWSTNSCTYSNYINNTSFSSAAYISVHSRAWNKSVHWIKQQSHVWNWLGFEQNFTSWIRKLCSQSMSSEKNNSKVFRFQAMLCCKWHSLKVIPRARFNWLRRNCAWMQSISVMTLGQRRWLLRWYLGMFLWCEVYYETSTWCRGISIRSPHSVCTAC
jgi:hypothetical protein